MTNGAVGANCIAPQSQDQQHHERHHDPALIQTGNSESRFTSHMGKYLDRTPVPQGNRSTIRRDAPFIPARRQDGTHTPLRSCRSLPKPPMTPISFCVDELTSPRASALIYPPC